MDMNNNDRLIRLRYALDLKETEMVEIFKLGDVDVSREEVSKLLTKSKEQEEFEFFYGDHEDEDHLPCSNEMFESFLNGLIVFKRGKQEPKPGQPARPAMTIERDKDVNNVMLKKLKIALSLPSEEIIAILKTAGVEISKGELSALLRKEGHKNYKICGDRYARNFLKGLAYKYRG